MKKTSILKGDFFLLMAALIWGLAFVFQTILIREGMKAFNVIFFRSVFGSITLFMIIFTRKKLGKDKYYEEYKDNKKRNVLIKAGLICGLMMVMACGMQQLGMQLYPKNIAVSARGAFITSMYIVLTAFVQTILGKKPHIVVIISILISMIGVYFMSFAKGIEGFYFGDIPLFICVIAYTVHIIVIDKFSFVDVIRLSFLQQVFSVIFSFPIMMIFEGINLNIFAKTVLPLLYMGCLSSAGAYSFQMIGQKYTEPAVAVIIMGLESVFSALFGYLFLAEKLTKNELIGCILVFISVMLAQIPTLWYNISSKSVN